MERPDPKKCCILVPSRGGVEQGCERGLYELARRGYELRVMRGVTSIDQIRCQMATDAITSGFEELFWIDDDVQFDPDDVDRLRTANLSIVGGVYPKKGEPQLAIRWKEGTTQVTLGKGGGILEVEYAATGFLLTRRDVFAAMFAADGYVVGQFDRPMIPCFMPMIVGDDPKRYLAEDWSFCERARRLGFQIWVDTRPRLMHVGRYPYSWEDLAPRKRLAGVTIEIAP